MWSTLLRSTNIALNGCHILHKTPTVGAHIRPHRHCNRRLYGSLNDDRHERYSDNGYEEHENKQQRCYNAFAQCGYQLLTSRFLETLGYLGAAIVFGLNLEPKFRYASSSHFRPNGLCHHRYRSHSSYGHSYSLCGSCHHCNCLLNRLITFASPIQKTVNNALPAINDKSETNNIIEINNTELKNDESMSKKDPIDQLCSDLQSASIEYIDQLTNMLGIALIKINPQEAMLCWQSCKSNTKSASSALFNIAVAFETGKHSSTGEADLTRAFYYYSLAASKGHKFAIYNLSLFYLHGKGGIEINETKAETLLKRAALLGVKRAKQYCEAMDSQPNRAIDDNRNQQMKTSVSAPNLAQMCPTNHKFNDSYEYDMNTYKVGLISIDKIPQSLRYLL